MEDSVSITVTIFGFITAIGVIYAIIRGVNSDTKNRNQNFTKMITEIDQELQGILDNEKNLQKKRPNKERCERYASDYLNVLDRIAFLRQLKKIDDDTIFYFDNYFAYGKLMLEWKYKVLKDETSTRERFKHCLWWIESSLNKNRLRDYSITSLPKEMQALYNKRNAGSTKRIPSTNKSIGAMPKGWMNKN